MPDLKRIHGGIGPARAIYLMPIEGLTSGNVIPSRGFWFPVGPQEYGKAGSSTWNTNRIAGMGEVAHRGGTNLETIELNGFFPGEYDPSLCRSLRSERDFFDPDDACKLLEKVRDQQLIFKLIVGTDIINERVRLTEFAWTETAGRPNDRGYSCKFETWIPQQIQRRGEIILPPIPAAYRLRDGEDIEDAALRIYGDVRQAPAIRRANTGRGVIGGVSQPQGPGLGRSGVAQGPVVVGSAADVPAAIGGSPAGPQPRRIIVLPRP